MSPSRDTFESSVAPTISVVVCTRNRAGWLRNVLTDLTSQEAAADPWEVLVVDNASTDDTGRTVAEFASRHSTVRGVRELSLGLSFARNRGWREARGRYVGYLDDDCRVPGPWIGVAMDVVQRVSPAVFGGPYRARCEEPRPPWFKDEYESHVQGDTARTLGEAEFLDGANVFFRRSLFESLGGFDENLGMKGRRVAYGEETEMMRRIRRALPGESVYYEPRLCVDHLVPPHKMTLRWRARECFMSGRSSLQTFGAPRQTPTRMHLAKRAMSVLKKVVSDLLRGVPRRDRARFPLWQNYVYEITCERFYQLGQLCEQLKTF